MNKECKYHYIECKHCKKTFPHPRLETEKPELPNKIIAPDNCTYYVTHGEWNKLMDYLAESQKESLK